MSHRSRVRRAVRRTSVLALSLVLVGLAACGDDGDGALRGNVSPDEVGEYDSVGFILDDGTYRFFAMPGVSWTRIIGIDAAGEQALVWFRDEPGTFYSPAVLDLETLEFTALTIEGLDGFVARGLTDDGRIVGGVSGSRVVAVIYDPATGEVEYLERPGADFTGINNAAANGLVLGYTDAGMATFVLDGSEFVDVEGEGANRLLGNGINSDGVVVGFASWGDDPMWDPLPRGFIASRNGDVYISEPFGLPGMARTSVVGINEAGRIAGRVHEHEDSPAVAYSADVDDPDGTFELHPLPAEITALLTTPGTGAEVWGIGESDRVFGTVFITDPEPELWDDEPVCGGHGHLHGVECHCDRGNVQDPDDPAMCIVDPDA